MDAVDVRKKITREGGFAGLLVRPSDSFVVWEVLVKEQYRGAVSSGDVVLDIGGHVGTFGAWALDAGAKRVVSIEPELSNYAILAHNAARDDRWETRQVAVASETGTTTIGGRGVNASVLTQTLPQVEVNTVTLVSLLEEIRPTSLKMDIEGAEYHCLTDEALDELTTVERLAMEWHFQKKWMIDKSVELNDCLRELGFTSHNPYRPPSRPTGWGRHIVYQRNHS